MSEHAGDARFIDPTELRGALQDVPDPAVVSVPSAFTTVNATCRSSAVSMPCQNSSPGVPPGEANREAPPASVGRGPGSAVRARG